MIVLDSAESEETSLDGQDSRCKVGMFSTTATLRPTVRNVGVTMLCSRFFRLRSCGRYRLTPIHRHP